MADPLWWQRPGPTPTQQHRDAWLAAAAAVVAAASSVLTTSMGASAFPNPASLAEQLLWSVLIAVPLAVRRRFPTTVLLAVAVLFIAAQAREAGDGLVHSAILFVALYTLGAWGNDRRQGRLVRIGIIVAMFGWLGFSLLIAALTTGAAPGGAGPLDPLLAAALYSVALNALYFAAAYHFGNIAWESARRRHELLAQQEELRRSQAENARQAVVAERLRIARDLHDVVAHHVSVMGIQAAAARRVFDRDQQAASTALHAIERTARTAVRELQELLGVLRSEPGPPDTGSTGTADALASADRESATSPSAVPRLDQLAELADHARATGLRVTYRTVGPAVPVPEAIGLSAYRVAQEALTNTIKHAGATHVDLRVRYLAQSLEVEVSDDGRGTSPDGGTNSNGSGLGLVGMRERMSVHNGDLTAGPRRQGGFQVRARFPLPAATDPVTDRAGDTVADTVDAGHLEPS